MFFRTVLVHTFNDATIFQGITDRLAALSFVDCEEVGVVKRVYTLLGGVHKLAPTLNVVEEVQEEVQE